MLFGYNSITRDVQGIVNRFPLFERLLLGSMGGQSYYAEQFRDWHATLEVNDIQAIAEIANHFQGLRTPHIEDRLRAHCSHTPVLNSQNLIHLLVQNPTLTNFFNRHIETLVRLAATFDNYNQQTKYELHPFGPR